MSVVSTALSGLQSQGTSKSNAASDKVSEDKTMFLKLLMAQMTNQDPLNPADDTEFISQLTQFTSVEQLMNINNNMQSVSDSMIKQQVNTAANLIGALVYAEGSEINIYTDTTDPSNSFVGNLSVEIPQELSSLTMSVNQVDSDGNVVGVLWSKNLGAQSAGTLDASDVWDGTDSSGARLPTGRYTVSFSALDKNGKSVLVSTKSTGKVIGFTTKEDGNHLLTLSDGREVALDGVEKVQAPQDTTTPTDTDKGTDTGTDSSSKS